MAEKGDWVKQDRREQKLPRKGFSPRRLSENWSEYCPSKLPRSGREAVPRKVAEICPRCRDHCRGSVRVCRDRCRGRVAEIRDLPRSVAEIRVFAENAECWPNHDQQPPRTVVPPPRINDEANPRTLQPTHGCHEESRRSRDNSSGAPPSRSQQKTREVVVGALRRMRGTRKRRTGLQLPLAVAACNKNGNKDPQGGLSTARGFQEDRLVGGRWRCAWWTQETREGKEEEAMSALGGS
ncbi:hypothetical protein LXL04_006607 [Taraxacum kok-saghyz]